MEKEVDVELFGAQLAAAISMLGPPLEESSTLSYSSSTSSNSAAISIATSIDGFSCTSLTRKSLMPIQTPLNRVKEFD